MHRRTQELLDYIDAQREILKGAVDQVPADRRNISPGPDRWSPAEVLEHLSRVEGSVTRLFTTLLAKHREKGIGVESEESSVMDVSLNNTLRDRSRTLTASLNAQPQAGYTADEAWEELERTRREFREAIMSGDGVALHQIEFPHPAFGPLNLYQWIQFIGSHEARHAEQIREVV